MPAIFKPDQICFVRNSKRSQAFCVFCVFLFAAWLYFNSNSIFTASSSLLPLTYSPINLMKLHPPAFPFSRSETCRPDLKSKRLPRVHSTMLTSKPTDAYLQHYSQSRANTWKAFYLAKLQVFSCSLLCPDLVIVTLFCSHSKDVFQLGSPAFLWPPPFLPFSPSVSSFSGADIDPF